jgi:ribosomal protein L7/L12
MCQKINAIKAVRALTGKGLTDSKNFVESAMFGYSDTAEIKIKNQDELDPINLKESINETFNNLELSGFTVMRY